MGSSEAQSLPPSMSDASSMRMRSSTVILLTRQSSRCGTLVVQDLLFFTAFLFQCTISVPTSRARWWGGQEDPVAAGPPPTVDAKRRKRRPTKDFVIRTSLLVLGCRQKRVHVCARKLSIGIVPRRRCRKVLVASEPFGAANSRAVNSRAGRLAVICMGAWQ